MKLGTAPDPSRTHALYRKISPVPIEAARGSDGDDLYPGNLLVLSKETEHNLRRCVGIPTKELP